MYLIFPKKPEGIYCYHLHPISDGTKNREVTWLAQITRSISKEPRTQELLSQVCVNIMPWNLSELCSPVVKLKRICH
jgi:hypothetical protein